MKSVEIKDVSDFIDRISLLDLITEPVIFRGQGVKGNLLPGVARKDPGRDSTEAEKEMLSELRKQGLTKIPSYVDRDNDWDLLVLAQHFGMKTRLLDWTSNALAALWFACHSKGKNNAYVYALDASNVMLKSLKGSPFDQSKTRVIMPNLSNDRIIAQTGCFTAHRFSEKVGRFVALEKNTDVKSKLTEYVIPASKKEEILISLERCGVSARSLYPDLGGLCQFLNWRLDGLE